MELLEVQSINLAYFSYVTLKDDGIFEVILDKHYPEGGKLLLKPEQLFK
jgi:hypothetical protein